MKVMAQTKTKVSIPNSLQGNCAIDKTDSYVSKDDALQHPCTHTWYSLVLPLLPLARREMGCSKT